MTSVEMRQKHQIRGTVASKALSQVINTRFSNSKQKFAVSERLDSSRMLCEMIGYRASREPFRITVRSFFKKIFFRQGSSVLRKYISEDICRAGYFFVILEYRAFYVKVNCVMFGIDPFRRLDNPFIVRHRFFSYVCALLHEA